VAVWPYCCVEVCALKKSPLQVEIRGGQTSRWVAPR